MCIRDRSWDSPLIPTCRLARLLPTKPSSFDSAVKCSRSSTSAVAANSAASCGWPVAPALSANSVYLAYANASACIAACRFAFVVGCSSCAAWAAPPEVSTSAATVAPSTVLHLRNQRGYRRSEHGSPSAHLEPPRFRPTPLCADPGLTPSVGARTEALGTRLRRVRHRLGTSAGSRGARRPGCRRGRPRAWTIADETALRTGQAVRVLGPGLRGDLPEDGG